MLWKYKKENNITPFFQKYLHDMLAIIKVIANRVAIIAATFDFDNQ